MSDIDNKSVKSKTWQAHSAGVVDTRNGNANTENVKSNPKDERAETPAPSANCPGSWPYR